MKNLSVLATGMFLLSCLSIFCQGHKVFRDVELGSDMESQEKVNELVKEKRK